MKNKLFLWSIALSICLHMGIVLLMPWIMNNTSQGQKTASEIWHAEPKKTLSKTVSPMTAMKKKVVVTLTPSPNSKRPKDARFLAEKDQSTKSEQKAVNSLAKGAKDAFVQTSGATKNSAPDLPVDAGSYKKIKKRFKKEHFIKESSAEGDPLRIMDQNMLKPGTIGAKDALPEVKEGDSQQLNAWQWRHAPFFNRIKQSIAQIWAPDAQIRQQDPDGKLLGYKDIVTVLFVTLNRTGHISDLSVGNTSGIAYLDAEAVRAFRASAPFPYPPPELFEKNGEFSFSFAFHLHLDRNMTFDFHWD